MANSLPNGVEKCTEYKNATGLDCLRCEEAYQVIYSGKYCSIYTLAETVEACVTLDRQFTSNNKKCSVCKDGYYLENNGLKCQKCPDRCTNCSMQLGCR